MLGRLFTTLFLVILLTFNLAAQAPTGDISGVVSDPSGALVPGVTVTLTNPATNAVRTALTNEAGLYVLRAIPRGVYRLRADLSGFGAVEGKNMEVQVGSSTRIEVTLEIGEVNSIVEVWGGAPFLQTETASVGTFIENRRIVELPLNG